MPSRTLKHRCTGCGMIPGRCLCERLPRVRLPWRLLILQHVKEAAKPTNTARLLARVIENCSIVPVGGREQPWSADLLGPADERRIVLFPARDARPLDAATVAAIEPPACFLLLDATWRQAGRMVRRAAGVAELPRVTLPPGGPSRWRARTAPRPDQLCTFETVVRLAALAPQSCDASAVEAAFELLLAAQSASSDRAAAQ